MGGFRDQGPIRELEHEAMHLAAGGKCMKPSKPNIAQSPANMDQMKEAQNSLDEFSGFFQWGIPNDLWIIQS